MTLTMKETIEITVASPTRKNITNVARVMTRAMTTDIAVTSAAFLILIFCISLILAIRPNARWTVS